MGYKVSKEDIVDAALKLATKHGFRRFSREQIANELGVTGGTLNYYFDPIDTVHDAVVLEAAKRRNWPVLVQALAEKHPLAVSMDPKIKREAADTLK